MQIIENTTVEFHFDRPLIWLSDGGLRLLALKKWKIPVKPTKMFKNHQKLPVNFDNFSADPLAVTYMFSRRTWLFLKLKPIWITENINLILMFYLC